MITMSQSPVDPKSQTVAAPTVEEVPAAAVRLWQRVEQLVVEHPKQSLAVAAVAGVVLGWIIKRRP
jgi:ElaB/YqjD/DUF883 family membrane-anchored ribosome-binding protein